VAESVTGAGAICGVTVQGRAEFLADGPERRALAEKLLAKYDPRLERLWGELTDWGLPAVAFESPRRLPASLAGLAKADPERPHLFMTRVRLPISRQEAP